METLNLLGKGRAQRVPLLTALDRNNRADSVFTSAENQPRFLGLASTALFPYSLLPGVVLHKFKQLF